MTFAGLDRSVNPSKVTFAGLDRSVNPSKVTFAGLDRSVNPKKVHGTSLFQVTTNSSTFFYNSTNNKGCDISALISLNFLLVCYFPQSLYIVEP